MAPRRTKDQNDRVVKKVVLYKALIEFDAPNHKYYAVDEIFSGEDWPLGTIDSAASWGVLEMVPEKVEDDPKIEDSLVFTESAEVEWT